MRIYYKELVNSSLVLNSDVCINVVIVKNNYWVMTVVTSRTYAGVETLTTSLMFTKSRKNSSFYIFILGCGQF